MDFSFDTQTSELRDLCRAFAQKEIAPHAAQWSEQHRFPTEVFKKMGELGLMGMLAPEEYGGTDVGFVPYVAAMEEIGVADQSVATSWNAHTTIASLPLIRYGTHEQKEKWLRPLAEGTHIGAFGLTEPAAGSDAASIRTRARREAGGWLINGTKMFITNAGTDMSLGVSLLAVTDDDGAARRYGTFFVPSGTEGFTLGAPLRKLGWNASDTRELVFEDCWVPDDHLIGDDGTGLRQFLEVLDPGRISVAALSLSLAEAALRLAVRQCREREQFGRPIAAFQAIAHKVADMATEVEAVRWLVYRAAWLADTGQPFGRAAAMAKLHASEVANRAASASLQIHGGYGYMRESEIARFYSDAKILEIGEGTSEIQRNVIARSVIGKI
ncbi:acyl-CoA dehydrogenase [Mycobacterium mantenii]|uniref:Acyl-CoA dehydrogenase n=1 Tax=Mycobacterium mantenii TaxID=560555 RepID=A0A1X0FMF5_MYCNT|nr:acyl-CoA dehydrogenase family protein [Mycobacterium mantenii]MCV7246527.1 acyl-CoA dehydrogenase family protein [Mycobacterium mantenii]ORB02835.1 acyl-CoA dehydrogenase [Mycobacterium mantenii]BBY38039.1 acyl-CoA dehydrogenase [Mycobacterium mantenii]